jgi:hypothetical protein
LASVFRARIELRQIGVRDEAKMIGGIGICGRPFCCAQFLDGFLPVSIKMAKTQNLSLNPTKISGTCGRLMCCLKYEQEAYEDAAARMPKVESFVMTPDGPGNVKSLDLLQETARVSLDNAPDPLKCYHNCELCVLRNGKGSREGVEVPLERPERYVESPKKKEEDPIPPMVTGTFFSEDEIEKLEDAPVREKIDGDRSHRRRRSRGRRSPAAAETETPVKTAAPPNQKKRLPVRPAGQKPGEKGGEKVGEKEQHIPEQMKGDAKQRRRPHHRGGRRRSRGGNEETSGAPTDNR